MSEGLFELVREHVTIFDMMERFSPESYRAVRSEAVGHKIPCPFAETRHPKGSDPHPSAKFFPETQSVYCWSCQGSWDVISYYAEARDMFKRDDQGRKIVDTRGGYKLDYGKAAYELGREYQLDYKVPDWYGRLRKTISVLKESQRQAPTPPQTHKLNDMYATKLQARSAPTLVCQAVEDYALGSMPRGSWVGIERDMHSWFSWAENVLEVTGASRYTPES